MAASLSPFRPSVHFFCLSGTISQYLLVRFDSFLVQMLSTMYSRYPISLVKINPLTLELLPLFHWLLTCIFSQLSHWLSKCIFFQLFHWLSQCIFLQLFHWLYIYIFQLCHWLYSYFIGYIYIFSSYFIGYQQRWVQWWSCPLSCYNKGWCRTVPSNWRSNTKILRRFITLLILFITLETDSLIVC